MHATLKAVVHGMTGLVLAGALLILGIVATIVTAVASDGRAEIPGVFEAWMEPYQDSPSLSFLPHATGMGVVIVVVTIGYVAAAYGIGGILSRRKRER